MNTAAAEHGRISVHRKKRQVSHRPHDARTEYLAIQHTLDLGVLSPEMFRYFGARYFEHIPMRRAGYRARQLVGQVVRQCAVTLERTFAVEVHFL